MDPKEPEAMLTLSDIGPAPGSRKKRTRVGRGIAAGKGKTCGRGMKGQKARSKVRRGFEGGQMPLQRRLPLRRGTSKRAMNIGLFRKEFAVVNVGALDAAFEAGEEITLQKLLETRAVRKPLNGLKVLGDGPVTKKLHVRASAFSASARRKIEAAGGLAEVV